MSLALDAALMALYPDAELRLESIREHKSLRRHIADDPDSRTEVNGHRRALVITVYFEDREAE